MCFFNDWGLQDAGNPLASGNKHQVLPVIKGEMRTGVEKWLLSILTPFFGHLIVRMRYFIFLNQYSISELSFFFHYKLFCMCTLPITSLGMQRGKALVAVIVPMRNCPVPEGTLVSDHVLEGKIVELACKELEATVAQVSPSNSCITVQF